MELLMSIYSLLSLTQSKPQSIFRFISLLSPLDAGIVSCYQDFFLSSLMSIVQSSLQEPATFFLLNGDTIEGEMETFETIDKGFSIALWLYIEPNGTDYHPVILEIEYDTRALIFFILSRSCLLLREDDLETESTAKLCENLKSNTWLF
jgi:hypothetical protein